MERSESAVGFPRVVSETIKAFTYKSNCSPAQEGEAVEVRAVGSWKEAFGENYPISVYITVPPGCPFIPATGDHLKVTIERCTSDEETEAADALINRIGQEVQSLFAKTV